MKVSSTAIPQKALPFLWYFLKKQPVAFAFIFTTSLSWSTNQVLFPYFIKWIVNTVHRFKGPPNVAIYHDLFWPVIGLTVCWLLMEIALRAQGMVMVTALPRLRANIRSAVFDYVKHHSQQYFSEQFAGSIAQKIAALPTSCQNVLEILCFNLSAITIGFLLAVIAMWLAHPIFAVILITWFVLHMGMTLLFMRIGNRYWHDHSESVTTLSGKIVDSLTNILNVRLFARGRYESAYLRQTQDDEVGKSEKAQRLMQIMNLFQSLFTFLLIVVIILTLIHGWVQGWVTVGDFSLITMLAWWVLGMVWWMSFQLTVFSREIGTINQSLTLIAVGHEITDVPGAKPLQVSQGTIQFNGVTFAYQKNNPVFKDLNVAIPAGQKIGLVGFSGAGKTTFVSLILRFFDLQQGNICIDGHDIARVTQDSLHEQVSMIPQDPSLFHRSLLENIRYGRLDATDEEVIQAAKLAHCHEFIAQLTDGYATLVGERGIKLSGGQRQRIAIARAILKNAPILILDEATSSLDSVTEKLIQESLQYLMANKTTLVIAHRLSTLAHMDRILVFHKGEIVEDGSKASLLALQGHFARMWDMQTNGFLPE